MKRYNPAQIEPKWQKYWEENKTYVASDNSAKPKYYALSMFPYPSGIGLHIGHVRNYSITDAAARFMRMQGHEVMQPMGWDAFGLPGENYAIKTGVAPQITTRQNSANFRRQAQHLGLSIDWSREFASSDPDYYKWTQWFFLLLHKRGLAYQKESAQFWCNECKTVLANEQVTNGCCWRHEDLPVVKKNLKQWFFKITDYAERLAEDLEDLDWSDSIKSMQRNWIGKSKGAEVDFQIDGSKHKITVFTTRPDTLFGATFMVLAPEHHLVSQITTEDQRQSVEEYIRDAQTKTDIDRMDENRPKTGVFTGAYAINPVNNAKTPVWIADYVLMGYGTGAIMAVPAHDDRDYAFAQKFNIDVTEVIESDQKTEGCYNGEGTMINSGEYDGMNSADARERIVADLAKRKVGAEKVNFKIRDWLISRQRYWGAPIPMIHCDECGTVPVPEDQLPVVLPELDDFHPSGDGRSPLAKVRDWVEVECPTCGGHGERETDTMDGFACSSWYFLRFADPKNDKQPFTKELAEKWLPVDVYVGGAEHAVMHLLYARMWTKVMQDAGLINFGEPFKALRNQGLLLAPDGTKFSKSKGNGVDPEDIIGSGYGADSLRTTILFLAPFDQYSPWSPETLGGVYRFLNRVWTLAQQVDTEAKGDKKSTEIERTLHKTIKRVTDDMHRMGYNTAIAALMELVNDLYKMRATSPIAEHGETWRNAIRALTQMLSPFAPHLAEELWEQFGGKGQVALSDWPTWNDELLVEDKILVVVQVNGKVRGKLELPRDVSQSDIEKAAHADTHIASYLTGTTLVKAIYVPGKLINFVVK